MPTSPKPHQLQEPTTKKGGDPRSTAGRPEDKPTLLGQVLTPPDVASSMARKLAQEMPNRPARILDPCVGPGTFPAALKQYLRQGDTLVALDIDDEMVSTAVGIKTHDGISYQVHAADYLDWTPDELFDAAILNPPYLRQEWLDQKEDLRRKFQHRYGVHVPGTANAYVYFLVKALEEIQAGGTLTAVVYNSWTYTRYGKWLEAYLAKSCTNLTVEHLGDQPFDGRLIDATILHATKTSGGHESLPQCAGPYRREDNRHLLRPVDVLYKTQRGLRLKQSDFFLCSLEVAPDLGATQFLKHVRYVKGYRVSDTHPQAALLVPRDEIGHPAREELQRRLEEALEHPSENESILTWAREKPDSWFSHATPPRAPIVFNYYVRGRPRHIYNPGIPYSDNFYGVVPKFDVPVMACVAALNADVTRNEIARRSRNQGSGLKKIQLYEYREVLTPAVHLLPQPTIDELERLGRLLVSREESDYVLRDINRLLSLDGVVGSEEQGVAVA